MPIVALVDYDNVKSELEERTSYDVRSNLDHIAEHIAAFTRELTCPASEVRFRLYGGWIDERGRFTPRAEWVMAALGGFERRRAGVVFIPEIITSLAVRTGRVLIGTLRARQSKDGRQEQKMVDTMMAVDALHFASMPDTFVLVVTDDDDLVPPLIAGQRHEHRPMHWVRRRKPCGTGPNDQLCIEDGIKILGITE